MHSYLPYSLLYVYTKNSLINMILFLLLPILIILLINFFLLLILTLLLQIMIIMKKNVSHVDHAPYIPMNTFVLKMILLLSVNTLIPLNYRNKNSILLIYSLNLSMYLNLLILV